MNRVVLENKESIVNVDDISIDKFYLIKLPQLSSYFLVRHNTDEYYVTNWISNLTLDSVNSGNSLTKLLKLHLEKERIVFEFDTLKDVIDFLNERGVR